MEERCVCCGKPIPEGSQVCDKCVRTVTQQAKKIEDLEERVAIMGEGPQTAEAEMEGGGNTWWYVCGECRGAIDACDEYCRHCGRKIAWGEL